MWDKLAIGIGGGILWGAIGYAKSRKAEAWDWKKFGTSVVIGVPVGIVAVVSNISFDNAGIQLFADAGLVGVLENFLKFLYRTPQPTISKKK